jgi:DNA-binding response OmpR family regulator
MMPGMSGWDVAQQMQSLRRERNESKAPFLLLTGWTGQLENNPKIEQCGVDGVLEKPIQFSELFAQMRRLTSKQPGP